MQKKTYTPLIILAGALIIGGFIVARPTIVPKANAQLTATYNGIPTISGKALFMQQSQNLTQNVDPTLVDLDSQLITCSPDVDSLMTSKPMLGGSCLAGDSPLSASTTTGMFLGGQCCGSMKDLTEYNTELQNLQQYKNIPDVPMNPYKTPVVVAKKWIEYDKVTNLTPSEQATMDQAMHLSKEGPCCCKCWHYYVNEGIAKKMIKDYHYTAQQVAVYWDTSSIC